MARATTKKGAPLDQRSLRASLKALSTDTTLEGFGRAVAKRALREALELDIDGLSHTEVIIKLFVSTEPWVLPQRKFCYVDGYVVGPHGEREPIYICIPEAAV